MANNELLAQRTAVWEDLLIGNVATTHSSGIMIPAGAIITSIRVNSPGALTNLAAASATFQLRVGTDSIGSVQTLKQFGAQTIPTSMTLNQAGGVYVPNAGELNMILQGSSNSSFVGTIDFYVDYFFVV
jgi:hypothetical protein